MMHYRPIAEHLHLDLGHGVSLEMDVPVAHDPRVVARRWAALFNLFWSYPYDGAWIDIETSGFRWVTPVREA